MRYAKKTILLDGRQYNEGDIVPYNLIRDEETAKMNTRDDGGSATKTTQGKSPSSKEGKQEEKLHRTKRVENLMKPRRAYKPRKPKVPKPE